MTAEEELHNSSPSTTAHQVGREDKIQERAKSGLHSHAGSSNAAAFEDDCEQTPANGSSFEGEKGTRCWVRGGERSGSSMFARALKPS